MPRKALIGFAAIVAVVLSVIPSSSARPGSKPAPAPRERVLQVRIGVETLRNPYWYAEHGFPQEAKQFWDKDHWERVLRGWADEGYNHVLFWVEPWNKHGWQTFLVRHSQQPEAKELTAERSDKLIAHVDWIFRRAHELGLKNLLFSYFIVTTRIITSANCWRQPRP